MGSELILDKEYKEWLSALKLKVRTAQIKAALKVNTELLTLYWELGADIVAKQANAKWGTGFLPHLSQDLTAEFPEMRGFSLRNLKYMKQWYLFYSQQHSIGQQAVAQLADSNQADSKTQQPVGLITQIPWGHNIVIVTKCKTLSEALYYAGNTLAHNWSRAVLVHQIESGLYKREGNAVNNFAATLPKPQSDLAEQTLKDPYIFDFLRLTKEYNERDLENGLVKHITKFLLELGAGFAYVGKQIRLQVGEREFFPDLLFYHFRLRCFVVVELKTIGFEPEHAGKLNFYLKAVDSLLKSEFDNPSIGILICKSRDRVVVEYALSDIHKPIGVTEYQLTESLPENLKSSLPSIEEIEAELSGEAGE